MRVRNRCHARRADGKRCVLIAGHTTLHAIYRGFGVEWFK